MKKMGQYDFEIFKKRNRELKIKSKSFDSIQNLQEEEIMDDSAMKKLNELIEQDPDKKIYESLKMEEKEMKVEDEKNILVMRPLRNFVWGLGHQAKQRKSN